VDVTALHAYTKANGLSFYHSMVWLVTQAVNETENLRYTLRGGEVYLLPALVRAAGEATPNGDLA